MKIKMIKKKPTEKEVETELQNLRHIETCFLTLFVSLMVTGLTLYVSLEKSDDLQKASFIMFAFSLLFSINHIRAIVLNNIVQRINAFIWDVGFFLMLVVLFIATIFTRILVSFSTVYPSIDFRLVSLIVSLLIIVAGLVFVQSYISRTVIPIFRKRVFPVLSYQKNFDNPFLQK